MFEDVTHFVEDKVNDAEKRVQIKLLRLLAKIAALVAGMLSKAADDMQSGKTSAIAEADDKPGIPPDTGG